MYERFYVSLAVVLHCLVTDKLSVWCRQTMITMITLISSLITMWHASLDFRCQCQPRLLQVKFMYQGSQQAQGLQEHSRQVWAHSRTVLPVQCSRTPLHAPVFPGNLLPQVLMPVFRLPLPSPPQPTPPPLNIQQTRVKPGTAL